MLDALLHELLLHIVHAVAHRADICIGILGGDQLHAALSAGKLLRLCLVGQLVYILVAHGASGLIAS